MSEPNIRRKNGDEAGCESCRHCKKGDWFQYCDLTKAKYDNGVMFSQTIVGDTCTCDKREAK